MRFAGPILAVLIAGAPALNAEVRVRSANGSVDVHAMGVPLAEVLDALARQTGMKVVYEGAPPRVLVNASVERRTAAQAVLSVLEGLGLNYAASLDATGTKVQMLVMSGAAPAGASGRMVGASAMPQQMPQQFTMPQPQPEEVVPEEEIVEEPQEEPTAEDPTVGAQQPIPKDGVPQDPNARPQHEGGMVQPPMPFQNSPFGPNPNPFTPQPQGSPSPGTPDQTPPPEQP